MFKGHTATVQCLLEGGADLHLRNKAGKLAADVASTPELKELLAPKGVEKANANRRKACVHAQSAANTPKEAGSSSSCEVPLSDAELAHMQRSLIGPADPPLKRPKLVQTDASSDADAPCNADRPGESES